MAKRIAGIDYSGEHNEYRPLKFKGTPKQKAESDAIIAKYSKSKAKSKDPVVVEGVSGTYELYTPVPKNTKNNRNKNK